ncbi:hypothetical protein DBR06_SOUSAS8210256 [Sousa chinensis]|uniref:C-type lectin domain-containing protein n=1 Tax=Sousa chinensis TaxID=103600 RepID=A0A484GYQ3_SOUCH|nr:hypothetical protein DBR06_SOUSAS8210256 [Sousa chinensis]
MSVKYEDLQYLESEGKSQGFTDGGSLQEMITSLKAEVESHKQELQAARSLNDKVLSLESSLENQLQELKAGQAPAPLHLGMRRGLKEQKPHPGHCPHCPSVCVPGYSEMLLRVQQLVKNLNSLTCKMAALKSNGSQNNCCPTSWLEHEGSCYWFSSSGKPWPEAEKYCQQEDAYLVDFVQAHIGSSYTWMGLSDLDGVWKWADGTDYETNFKNWKPGQPDDWQGHGLGGGEDCAHFHPDGKWNDDACQRPYHWICEAGLSKGS